MKQEKEFLVWLVSKFGYDVRYVSYVDLGIAYNKSRETVRLYLQALEKEGYLTIEKVSAYKRAYHLNKDKLNELLG